MPTVTKKKTSGPSGKHVTPRRWVSMSSKEFGQTETEAKREALPWSKWARLKLLGLLGLAALGSGCAAGAGSYTGAGSAFRVGAATGTSLYIGPARPAQMHCYTSPNEPRRCFPSEQEMKDDYRERQHVIIARHLQAERDAEAAKQARFDQGIEQHYERERQLTEAAKDPAVAVPVISAIMCQLGSKLAGLQYDRTHDERVTAEGGVANFTERRENAEETVSTQEAIEFWNGVLKTRFGSARRSCEGLTGIFACHKDLDQCDDTTSIQNELWLNGQPRLAGSNP